MASTTSAIESPGELFATASVRPRLVRVARRGPILRPSPTAAGVFGLDLTAGCLHDCPFCHIRDSSRFPGGGRVLFDPFTSEHLAEAMDAMEMRPRQVVLSPSSDPFPKSREVRAEAAKVIALLLDRQVAVQIMTRGRVPRPLIERMARDRDRVKVAVGLMSLDRPLSRVLEGSCSSPFGRLADLGRMAAAGLDVEARLEPLIPGRTDTRDNLSPLFEALATAGVRKVVAHYLYSTPAARESLDSALTPLGWSERMRDDFEGGNVFRLGTIGPTKHFPLELRRSGLARLIALGAEFGLNVTTGSAQNPDLPRLG